MSAKDQIDKKDPIDANKKASNQPPISNPATDNDTVNATLEKTDGRTKTGKTETKADQTGKTEKGDAKTTDKTAKTSEKKTGGAKVDGSAGKSEGVESKGGSGGLESETGGKWSSDERKEKKEAVPAAPSAPAPPKPTTVTPPPAPPKPTTVTPPPAAPSLPRPSVKTATSIPRPSVKTATSIPRPSVKTATSIPRPSIPRPSAKTAKCPSVSTAKPIGAQSNGRKTGPGLVIAKPSGPRALVKSTPTPSASSTTKGSSSTAKSSQKKSKTPTDPTVELTEKTAVEPPAGPPAWHCGWLIAGVLIVFFVVTLAIMIVFVAAKGMDDAADKAEWAKEDSSLPNGRRSRDTEVSHRAKFRLREPPDPL